VTKLRHYPHRNCPQMHPRSLSNGTGKAACHPTVGSTRVGQPALLRSIHLQRRCTPHPHPRNRRPTIGVATRYWFYAANGAASQGEGRNLEVCYGTAAVAYHQREEARHGERPIGTEPGRESRWSTAALAQLISVDSGWQADGRPISDNLIIIITNSAGSVNRLTNLGPHHVLPSAPAGV
jgi:hypothetical protein